MHFAHGSVFISDVSVHGWLTHPCGADLCVCPISQSRAVVFAQAVCDTWLLASQAVPELVLAPTAPGCRIESGLSSADTNSPSQTLSPTLLYLTTQSKLNTWTRAPSMILEFSLEVRGCPVGHKAVPGAGEDAS